MSLITYLTRIHFADRVIEDALAEELARLGVRRPLVLTDAEGERGDDLDRLLAALPDRGAPVLSDLDGQPPGSAAQAVLALAAQSGCDGLVAMGGSAALDCARLAGLASRRPATLTGVPDGPAAARRAAGAGLAVVAVPTLPGQGMGLCPALRLAVPAGAEAAPHRLVCDRLLPALVLCDPTLGLDVPPERLAASGFDALVHCIEAWLGTAWNPPADGIALEGVRRAAGALLRAVQDPRDIDARREVLAAGLNGGLAAPKGLGAVHALAHALEAHLQARAAAPARDHGRHHAALLPHVLAFNAPAVPERLEVLARALDLGPGQALEEGVARLGARLGLPGSLAGLGIDARARSSIARRAEAEPANRTNPRLASAEDHLRLLAAAGADGAPGCAAAGADEQR